MRKIDIRSVVTFFSLFSVVVALKEERGVFNPRLVQQDTSGKLTLNPLEEEEYLRNNYGYIWRGTVATVWNYAVDSPYVIESRNRLEALMAPEELENVVIYSRALTRVINQHVLHGRWDGNYGDGVDPSSWVGSEDILRRWLESGARVRYGQCWVFCSPAYHSSTCLEYSCTCGD